jgi:hypothetical protein
MKHLVLTQFGTPSESVALHDDPDPTPGPNDVPEYERAARLGSSPATSAGPPTQLRTDVKRYLRPALRRTEIPTSG